MAPNTFYALLHGMPNHINYSPELTSGNFWLLEIKTNCFCSKNDSSICILTDIVALVLPSTNFYCREKNKFTNSVVGIDKKS